MPPRSFHRSQSAIQQPLPSERAYRRAEKFLRDFHRSRSLDIILEEYDGQQHQHHGIMSDNSDDAGASSSSCGLKKKRAVLCLADLVQQQQQQDGEEVPDGSENTADSEQQPHREEDDEDEGMNTPYWGHFAVDSPSEQATASSSPTSRRHTIPLPSHTKTRTIRRFGKS